MQAFPSNLGGDLEGGESESRNADVDALKRAFYGSGPAEADGPADGVARVGRYLDLPVARWSMVFVPAQQVLLNVFQPQYTLMFESLLAGPRPWLYMHVLLPGGADNLANPEYALPDDDGPQAQGGGPRSRAPLVGTLMEVVSVERQPDARLAMVAQGLGRAVVVRATQSLPYARADVQLLPDAETLLAAACTSSRWLRQAGTFGAASAERREQLTLGAVVGENACWQPYENEPAALVQGSAPGTVLPPPAMCKFDVSAAEKAATSAERAVVAALEAVPADAAARGPPLLLEALVATSASLEVYDDEEEAIAEDAAALLSLEIQLWLELDHFLRRVAAMQGSDGRLPVPRQLLCLLPPPPETGWPEGFVLSAVVSEIKRAQLEERSLTNQRPPPYDAEPYVPLHPSYPPRRRAERLSWSIWLVIREEGLELQPLMDAPSISDRLRMALLRLRDLVERLPPKGKGQGSYE